MELVFLWVKRYGCFKETGFHFHNTYQFEYDLESSGLRVVTGMGTYKPKDFFGENISNLSVIVGDNGAGKTTVLRLILDCLAGDEANVSPFIAGFFAQDEQELRIYNHELQIRNIESKGIRTVLMDKIAFEEWMESTKFIYVNNVLDIQDYSYKKPGYTHDLSVGGLMRRDHSSGVENRHIRHDANPIIHFSNNEVYRQIDFLYHYKQGELDTEFLFKMVNSLQVEITDNDWNRRYLAQSIEKYYPQKEKPGTGSLTNFSGMPENEVGQLLTMISGSFTTIRHNNLWKVLIADHLLINAIKDTAEPVTTSDNRQRELECLLKAYLPLSANEDILTYCRDYLVRAEIELDKEGSVFAERLVPYRAFVEWMEVESRALDLEIDAASASIIRIMLNDHNKERFRVFFDHYNRTCYPFYFLNFSWGLSTGQSNLLSLYSRLHSVLKPANDGGGRSDKVVNHLNKPCTGILLLIDEADLSFHPKWQVQYISRLLYMLRTIYKSAKVQVILTSHSPMLLSDVPKSNVMYLQEGTNDSANNHAETFGQNIYTLFNDAFFMDLKVGEFANGVIQSVGNGLNELVQSAMLPDVSDVRSEQFALLEHYEYITGIIGEPVIRKAFETKLQRLKEAYRTEKLKSAISLYEELSQEDRDRLIDYIIKDNEKDRDQ
ncbi:AAA family ATPase [Paenibacillus sp. HW567]|uniref:AAA family ATPase n=1 Tax=Paenibacillus sp. HW567 TaxID=1034769 RepID=UPI000364AFE3|nr:AAA family ATPase [Paenibacillus sp. HW567]